MQLGLQRKTRKRKVQFRSCVEMSSTYAVSELKIRYCFGIYLVSLNGNWKLKRVLLAPENPHLCLNVPICKWQHGHFVS